jgi:hypothetical protein
MNQPVSNNSFKPHHGYLGVFLHEGGPLTDALWNESSDIQWNLVRWLAHDAGLFGTTGPELRVDGWEEKGEPILLIRGGPGRFYCDGLPVLWPEDRRIDAQAACCEPWITDRNGVPLKQVSGGNGWTNRLQSGQRYYVYLDVWVDTVDALERPFLDDPGICCEPGRGSFRKVVRSCVRIAEGGIPQLHHTNLELTIQGTYQSDRNALYAVELVGLSADARRAELLWDDAGGAIVSVVTREAAENADSVELQSTRGFEVGHRVRFDGCGISNTIYRIENVDGARITIRRDPCSAAPGASDGLAEALEPWDKARAAGLVATAHPFSYCLVVEDRPDWTEGMRVLISAEDPSSGNDPDHDGSAEVKSTREPCLPGQGRVRSQESRIITKIVRCAQWTPPGGDEEKGKAKPERPEMPEMPVRSVMFVRLDEPLSYEHTAGIDTVTPARVIRAQRFAGHACDVHIGSVRICGEDGDGPCCLTGPLRLPSGLELFLTTPFTGGDKVVPPTLVPGDGWRFVARGSGWVDRPVFAPVEPRYRCRTALASFQWNSKSYFKDMEDLRPIPRGCHEDIHRALIRQACHTIARRFPEEEIGRTAEAIRQELEQRRLVDALPRLTELWKAAEDHAGRQEASDALDEAVDIALQRAPGAPLHAELEAVSAAVTRLSEEIRAAAGTPPAEARPAEARPAEARPAEATKPRRTAPARGAGGERPSSTARKPAARKSVSHAHDDIDETEAAGAAEERPQKLGAIPLAALRTMDEIRSDASRARLSERWPTLADCLRDREPPRGRHQEQILAAVQELAQRTAAITSRIGEAGQRDDALLAELEALWNGAVRLETLGRKLSLADAARFADDWALARGDS